MKIRLSYARKDEEVVRIRKHTVADEVVLYVERSGAQCPVFESDKWVLVTKNDFDSTFKPPK